MKISYRTHPILERIENKKLGKISVDQRDANVLKPHAKMISTVFSEITSIEKIPVYYLTAPFTKAFEMAKNKLIDSNLWKNIEDQTYCLLVNKESFLINIKNDKPHEILDLKIFHFAESDIFASYGECSLIYDDELTLRLGPFTGFISVNLDETPVSLTNLAGTWALMNLFIKYAEIQTKELTPKSKNKDINCKYINDTKTRVTMLDSTWFTTLVKSDAFKVRGHFRLQPKKKDGEWIKELIWINDFGKGGYTRKAGILQQ